MPELRRIASWDPPPSGGRLHQEIGFHTSRLADVPRAARVCIDDIGVMIEPAARRRLLAVIRELVEQRLRPRVEIVGIASTDDLLLAGTIALLLHFKSDRIPILVAADSERIEPELLLRLERAIDRPRQLLQLLERVTLARMHELAGARDHEAIAALAPRLDFIGIIADGDPELAYRLARVLDANKRSIQFMPTRRCHLRCVYCPVHKCEADLDLSVARRGLDLLLNSRNEHFRVDFTGGEPLLRKPWVMQLMQTARRRADEAGKRAAYYLVTNAIELTDEFARFLTGYDIEVEISIDGDEASHNRYKIPVDDSINPYRTLIENFRHVDRHGIRYNAVLVFTPDSLAALPNNIDHILSLGFRNISINYAIGYSWDDKTIARYIDVLVDQVERHDMLESGEAADLFINNLRYKTEPTVLNSELMLDTDGTLHLLSEWQFRRVLRQHPPPFRYSLDTLASIDEVFFTKAQVYHLLYEVYRTEQSKTLRLIHNSVEMGLEVSRRLSDRLGGRLPARC